MVINSQTFVYDVFDFLKTDLLNNIEDPLGAKRMNESDFVLTAYPLNPVQYPIITLKILNTTARRSGMQTTAVDTHMKVEVRVWARNTKERDSIFTDVLNRLKSIQFLSQGSSSMGLHDFNISSAVEVNEDGQNTPKSKLIVVEYDYYNPQ
jgi:hypothetical protein